MWSENGDQNDGRCEGCCEVRCGDGGEGGAVGGEKTNTSQIMGISHLLKVIRSSAEIFLEHSAR